jgi:hypothetical protein
MEPQTMIAILQHTGTQAALLLLCTLCATAQHQPPADYSGYFDSILLIEEATSREDFAESLKLYSQTFREYHRVFARDAYNACQLAALTRHEQFDTFFVQCARSGVPISLLLRNRHIAARYNPDSTRLHSLYIQGHALYRSRINTSLRNEFAERFALEQKSKSGDRYRTICTDNYNRIVTLAAQGRFPGEAVIGPDDDLGNSHVLATLLHYPYSYSALESALWNAVQSGNAQPAMVLYLYSFNQTRTGILYDSTIPVDTTHFAVCYNLAFGKQSSDMVEVNRQRRLRRVVSTDVEAGLAAVAAKYSLDYRPGY